ncbi:hypothetical protein [Rosenbergiella collisarenosi]|uniref:hypothetical protein n=1 Tax=Rosenbergiella collisarenosi TaxID=1544695 RepID=UPI001F4EB093|nr:hypothetical protein [Rosenbergiella collisarenosi]
MNHHILSTRDLVCLEHIRNAGHFINDSIVEQQAQQLPSPSQRSQLASLIFLMTEQLDGVVTRCHDNWMNEEVKS